MTFPFAHLLANLVSPQRQAELQDALSEVLQARCRIKLVLASQYKPKPRTDQAAHSSETRVEAVPSDVQRADDLSFQPAPGTHPEADAGARDAQVPEEIVRWAQKHGGEVSIIPS